MKYGGINYITFLKLIILIYMLGWVVACLEMSIITHLHVTKCSQIKSNLLLTISFLLTKI